MGILTTLLRGSHLTKDQLEVLAYYDSLGDVRGRAVKTAQHFGINRSTVYTYLQRRESPQPPPQQNNAAPVNIADVLRERPRTLAELTEVLDMSPSQVRAMLVETLGVQRDGDAFSIPSVAKSDDIIAALRKTPLTLTEIAARLKMPESEASRLCAALKMQGINIHTFGDKYSVEPAPQMGNHANDNRYRLVANKNGYFKFGVTSDNHLCSKYYRDDVLQKLYDNFAEAGISHVYNAGNWIDGEARFNKFELLVHGMNQQIEYFLEHYPQRTGINTYFIAGDDHEGWYAQREGVDIGLYTEMKAIKGGRSDLHYLGYIESYVDLVHPSTNRSSKLLVCHPGGGSSYAISYTSQKSVEAYDGGEKPAVALYGHYHKLNYSYIRNVHAIQTGCTQDQSSFMRKKKIAAHLGGVIVEGWLDENGAVTRCKTEFLTFFDRGYYQNQWNLASGIKQHSI